MKYLLGFVLIITIASCSDWSGINTEKVPLGNRTIQTIEYDSCEYVYLRRYASVTITHKGNCKFCEKRNIK